MRVAISLMVDGCLTLPSWASLIYYTAQVDPPGSFSHLYSVALETGQITDLGAIDGMQYVTDLASGDDGTLYGVAWSDGQATGGGELFTIIPGDEQTPAYVHAVNVASGEMLKDANAAAVLADELFVASSKGKFQKLAYDPDADAWQVVKTAKLKAQGKKGKGKGKGGGKLGSGGDLAFSSDRSRLYIALSGGALGTVDFDSSSPDFGKVTVIGPTGYDEITGLAMIDGQLYGTTNGPDFAGDSFLVRLDTTTGQASVPSELIGSAWGAAPGGNAVPEAGTLSLILSGAVALLVQQVRKRL